MEAGVWGITKDSDMAEGINMAEQGPNIGDLERGIVGGDGSVEESNQGRGDTYTVWALT